MKRIFYNESGEVVDVNFPNQRYLGGFFVEDESKPIYKDSDDLTKPILVEVDDLENPIYSNDDDLTRPIIELVDDETKPLIDPQGRIAAYDKKKIIAGYEKVILGYQKKMIPSGAYEQVSLLAGYEQRELTLDDCKVPDSLKSYSMITVSDDLPDHEYTNQMLVVDGKITVDNEKTKTLMPLKIVKQKYISYLKNEIASEMDKSEADSLRIIELKQDLDDCLENDDELFWTEKSLEGLDRASVEKPVIKQKLEGKISELKSKN